MTLTLTLTSPKHTPINYGSQLARHAEGRRGQDRDQTRVRTKTIFISNTSANGFAPNLNIP